MSVFLMPKGVAEVINPIQQRLSMGWASSDRKIYKVARQVVRGKSRGGLGVG